MSATRTQIYLTEDQRARIDRVAEAEGVTMAELIRRALDEYLGDDTDSARPRSQPRSAPIPPRRHRRATRGAVADLLVDTDIFIDHLRGAAELKPARHRLHYSVITRAELFAGNTATALTTRLLAPFREIAVDRTIAEPRVVSRVSSGSGSPML